MKIIGLVLMSPLLILLAMIIIAAREDDGVRQTLGLLIIICFLFVCTVAGYYLFITN